MTKSQEKWEGVVNQSTTPQHRAPLPYLSGRCATPCEGAKWGTEFACAASTSQTDSSGVHPLSITTM